jgi:UDP-N-acetylglucosamine 2-epimerase (non-hydrolysing)
MKKILVVFGTRPEAVKMAPLISRLVAGADYFETRVCVTAQHRAMLDQILDAFEIRPHYDLDIMTSGQDLYDVTTHVLAGIRPVLAEFGPDLVLIQGDTTTTFVTALAAYYERIDVGHVEAGLRTGNIYSPYPEEINRQLTTRLSKYHFAPTTLNRENLLNENVDAARIAVTGNTVIDALLMVVDRLGRDAGRREQVERNIQQAGLAGEILESSDKLVLITGHRRESFGAGFINICEAIRDLAGTHKDARFVYPVHLNPNVRKPVEKLLSNIPNVHLMEPLPYEEFVHLMSKAYLLLTDSGGIQEEAPALAKPVLVMRENTERPEALDAGTARLVGTDRTEIAARTGELLTDKAAYERMATASNPYGDGRAAEKIVSFLAARLTEV